MSHLMAQIVHIASYGLLGAFLLALAERLVPVVPSYGLFVFLGSTFVVHPLDLAPLIVVTAIASTISAVCWYGIGYSLGETRTHALVKRYGRYVCLSESLYLSLAARYTRNAFFATFIGQTIPVVRCYLSLPAGILALPIATFALAILAGSAIWVGGLISLGYGLHVLGWNPMVATLIAAGSLLAVEGGLFCLLRRRRTAA